MPSKKKSTPKKEVIEEVQAPDIELDELMIETIRLVEWIIARHKLRKEFNKMYWISAWLWVLLWISLTLLYKSL